MDVVGYVLVTKTKKNERKKIYPLRQSNIFMAVYIIPLFWGKSRILVKVIKKLNATKEGNSKDFLLDATDIKKKIFCRAVFLKKEKYTHKTLILQKLKWTQVSLFKNSFTSWEGEGEGLKSMYNLLILGTILRVPGAWHIQDNLVSSIDL